MKIPHISTKLEITITKSSDEIKMVIYDTLTPVYVCENESNVFYLEPQFLNNFYKNLIKKGSQLVSTKLNIYIDFGTDNLVSVLETSDCAVFSQEGQIDSRKVDLIVLNKFSVPENYIQMYGFIEEFTSSEEIKLCDLYNHKTNDYSLFEEFINLFISNQSVSTDFGELAIESLVLPLTIVIPSHDSENTLRRLLLCLDNQILPLDYYKKVKIIIVDDHSDNEVNVETLNSRLVNLKNILVIRTSNLVFVGQGRNIGYVNVDEGLILTLDSDILPQKNFLINHAVRGHLYSNVVTCSTRENIEDNEGINANNLLKNYNKLKCDITKDSRYSAHYPADYIGGPGHEFDVRALNDTNNFKDFGYGRNLISGIDLSLMLKGHNFCLSKTAVNRADYCGRFFEGWGEDDGFLAKKLIASGVFVMPILSTGVLHINHPPRLYKDEVSKIESLKKNIQLRKLKLKLNYYKHVH